MKRFSGGSSVLVVALCISVVATFPSGVAGAVDQSASAASQADSGLSEVGAPATSQVSGRVSSIAVQGDGRMLIGGSMDVGWPWVCISSIIRLQQDGAVDTSFETDPGVACSGEVNDIAVQEDGGIIVAGLFWDGIYWHPLVRLDPNGVVDWEFGAELRVLSSGESIGNAVSVLPSGKVLAGGSFSYGVNSGAQVLRLTSTGVIDPSFLDTAGQFFYEVEVRFVEVQDDGRIVIAGGGEGDSTGFIARLHEDGAFDPGFDMSQQLYPSEVTALALGQDGTVLVGGLFSPRVLDALWGFPRLVRFTPDGSVDRSFNPDPDGPVLAIAVQPDGRILVGGKFGLMGKARVGYLARVDNTGHPDRDFQPELRREVETIAFAGPRTTVVGGRFGVELLTDVSPPTAVTGLSVRSLKGAIRVSWTPPVDDGGARFVGYRVRWGRGAWIPTAGTSWTITGKKSRRITAYVQATNSAGEGPELRISGVPR